MEGTFCLSAFERLKVDMGESGNELVIRVAGVFGRLGSVVGLRKGAGVGASPRFVGIVSGIFLDPIGLCWLVGGVV